MKIPKIRFPKNFFQSFLTILKRLFHSLKDLSHPKRLLTKEKLIKAIKFLSIIYLILTIALGGIIYSRKLSLRSTFFRITSNIFPLPVTFVGPRVVWLKNILQQEAYIYHFASHSGQEAPQEKELTTELINLMIETEMARRDLTHFNQSVTFEEIKAEMEKIFEENGGEVKVEEILVDLYGMPLSDFRRLVEDQLVREKFRTYGLLQLKVRHILIGDEGKAKEIAEKAKAGENFEELAGNLSEDQNSKDKGGELGWIGRDSGLIPEFEEALFKMDKDQISDPLKSEFGFHIIKVEDKRGFVDKKYADWLDEAKKRYKVFQFIR